MLKTLSTLILVALLSACTVVQAADPKVIPLSSSEKVKAMALLEHRQAIFLKRQKLDAQYQSDLHRLDEEMNGTNIDAQNLCFELKKAHSLAPNLFYELDEVNARLVKK